MTTTYCDSDDVRFVLSDAGLLSAVDDDGTGAQSTDEDSLITSAIEIAAMEINASVERQYKLADVTSNAFLKWANAYLAAARLMRRRGNPLPESIGADCEKFRTWIEEISWGRRKLPEQADSFEHTPTVSTFRVVPGAVGSPIRVSTYQSTGSAPEGNRKRNIGGFYGWW